MTIETKFNLGDRVYVLSNGFIRIATIIRIRVLAENDPWLPQYLAQVKDQEPYMYNENEVYATKEDLYKYLSMYV